MRIYVTTDPQHYGLLPESRIFAWEDDEYSIIFDLDRSQTEDCGHYWPWNWEVAY
jgi:hypothetical protein